MIAINTVHATSRAAAYAMAEKIPGAWVGYRVSEKGYRWVVHILEDE